MGLPTEIRGFDVNPREGPEGTAFLITGQLYSTTEGIYLPDKLIKFYWNTTYLGEMYTDYNGYFNLKAYLYVAGTYDIHAEFEGDATYDPCSSPTITITVSPEAPPPLPNTTISGFDAYPREGVAPITVTLSGKLLAITDTYVPLADKTIELYRNASLLTSVTTGSDGVFSYDDYITAGGEFVYQAKFPGDAEYAGCESPKVSVSVTAAPPPGKGTLEAHAYADTEEVAASVEVVGVGTYTTPFSIELDPGTYTLNAVYNTQTQSATATIVEGQVTTVEFTFARVAPPVAVPIWVPVVVMAALASIAVVVLKIK